MKVKFLFVVACLLLVVPPALGQEPPSDPLDYDGDGYANDHEANVGSSPLTPLSTPETDDDGDGTKNRNEPRGVAGTTLNPSVCTGAYGIVLGPICGGYVNPPGYEEGAGVGSPLVHVDPDNRVWVWDGVCIYGSGVDLNPIVPTYYELCKGDVAGEDFGDGSSNYDASAELYDLAAPCSHPTYGSKAACLAMNGYGWRRVTDAVVDWPVVLEGVPHVCGVEDGSPSVSDVDGDGFPSVALCTSSVSVYGDGSSEWASSSGVVGEQWLPEASPTTTHLYGVSGDVAVGGSGLILERVDGVWTQVASPTTSLLYAVSGDVAVGGSGVVLERVDGVWQQVASPTTTHLYGVSGDVAVGESGLILERVDGVWTQVSSPTTQILYGVSGDVAVGNVGVIVERVDGVWTQVASPTTSLLYSVSGDVAVGNAGLILERVGGAWTQVASPTTSLLYAVSGDVAVGGSGVVLERVDGVWTQVSSPTTLALRGVAGDVAVGNSGTILERQSVVVYSLGDPDDADVNDPVDNRESPCYLLQNVSVPLPAPVVTDQDGDGVPFVGVSEGSLGVAPDCSVLTADGSVTFLAGDELDDDPSENGVCAPRGFEAGPAIVERTDFDGDGVERVEVYATRYQLHGDCSVSDEGRGEMVLALGDEDDANPDIPVPREPAGDVERVEATRFYPQDNDGMWLVGKATRACIAHGETLNGYATLVRPDQSRINVAPDSEGCVAFLFSMNGAWRLEYNATHPGVGQYQHLHAVAWYVHEGTVARSQSVVDVELPPVEIYTTSPSTGQWLESVTWMLFLVWPVYVLMVMRIRNPPLRIVAAVSGFVVLFLPFSPLAWLMWLVLQAGLSITVMVQSMGKR